MKVKFIFHANDGSEIGDQTFETFPAIPRPGDIFDSSAGNFIFDSGGLQRFVVSQVVYRFIGDAHFLPVIVCTPEQ